MLCAEYKSIHGIQIYLDKDYGLLVAPQALLSLPPEKASELALWCGKHNTEAGVIMTVRSHSAQGEIDHNFPDWMVEVIANGELADKDLRQFAKKELEWRRNGMWPPHKKEIPSSKTTAHGYVYLVVSEDGAFKVGITGNMQERFQALQTSVPMKISLLHVLEVDDCLTVERHFHRIFAERKITGEWFRLTEEDIALFQNYEEASGNNDNARPATL